MKTFRFSNPHRAQHFEHFRGMSDPHFSVCARVEVDAWIKESQVRGLSLNTSLVFLLASTANEIPQFRQRIRGDDVVEHEIVHPSFAVATQQSDVFSFCGVEYCREMKQFMQRAQTATEEMKTSPSFANQIDRDDYLFMSCFPWVDFLSVRHPMDADREDSVPRITWGKLVENQGRRSMSLSVQAHHALVDGVHMGHFFQRLEAAAAKPKNLMDLPGFSGPDDDG